LATPLRLKVFEVSALFKAVVFAYFWRSKSRVGLQKNSIKAVSGIIWDMKKWVRAYRVPVLIFLGVAIGLASWQTVRVRAASGSLFLTPVTQNISVGSTLSVAIHEDSGTEPINAVQVKLNYPTDKLTYSNTSYSGSSFDVHASEVGGSGVVNLSVGKTPPAVIGDKLVATVNFQVIASGNADISFGCNFSYTNCTDGNTIVRSTDNTDILAATTGASAVISEFNDNIAAGRTLSSGQSITSRNVMNMLIMQTDGNLVLYGGGRPLWFSGTGGSGATKLVMQIDGNLVLYRANNTPVWWSGTGGRGASSAVLQDDGNFVIYTNSGGIPTWFTGTGGHPSPAYFGSDRLTSNQAVPAGQYLRAPDGRSALVLNTDGSLVLYAGGYRPLWNSSTNGSGATKLVMQIDGNLVLYRANNTPVWWSGTGGNNNSSAILQTDGNFVIYNNSGVPIWFTGTGGKL
jgi:hypothetical protein